MRLVLDPLIPLPVALGVMGVLVLLAGLSLWRGARRGTGWRLLAGLLGIAALLNPVQRQETREPLPDTVLAVLDQSDSMDLERRAAERDAALQRLREQLPKAQIRTATIRNDGQGTRLLPTLQQELATLPPGQLAAITVIGDGQWVDAAAAKAILPPVPVTALLTGNPDAPDRAVAVGDHPQFGLVGKALSVTVTATDTMQPLQTPLAVTLSGEGITRDLSIPNGQAVSVDLPIRHAGQNRFLVAIAPLPAGNELTLLNNRQLVQVTGVRDRLKVLLVSGAPHPGGRNLRALFRGDPLVDLVHFTILRSPDKFDPVPARDMALIPFPVDELFDKKINSFDLIVLDRYGQLGVLSPLYLQNMAQFVMRGKGMLVISGPEYAGPQSLWNTPLQRVLPVQPRQRSNDAEYFPVLTDRGEQHPVTAGLPSQWGPWQRVVSGTVREGTTLLRTPAQDPLLVLETIGPNNGRVAQIMTDRFWLWQRDDQGGGPYTELVRNVAHWLMQDPDLDEKRLVARVDGDTLSVERHGMPGDSSPVKFILPDGTARVIPVGDGEGWQQTATLTGAEPGLYQVISGDLSTIARVGMADPVELANPRASVAGAAALAPHVVELSKSPGFTVQQVSDPAATPRKTAMPVWERQASLLRGSQQTPLLPFLVWITLAAGCLVVGWVREGKAS